MDSAELTEMALLLPIAQYAEVNARGFEGDQTTFIRGTLRFEIDLLQGQVVLSRIGLISTGVLAEADEITKQQATGRISIYQSQTLKSSISVLSQNELQLSLTAKVNLLYERLLYQQLQRKSESGRPLTEPLEDLLNIDATIRIFDYSEFSDSVGEFSGTLRIGLLAERDTPNLIQTITLTIKEQKLYMDKNRLLGQLEQKVIHVQPFLFADNEDDQQSDSNKFQTQLERANQLWNPGCISFQPLEPKWITNSLLLNLKTSDDTVKIASIGYLDANGNPVFSSGFDESGEPIFPDDLAEQINVIEVFLVHNELAADHGGVTEPAGNGFDKIVISALTNNDQLLAHELGHVLRLLHPGAGAIFQYQAQGSTDSLMINLADTGDSSHPAINTLKNCLHANNPAEVLSIPPYQCTHPNQDPWGL